VSPKTFPIQGRDYEIAPVTPERLAKFMEVLGIKTFRELQDASVATDMRIRVLDISLDLQKVQLIVDYLLVKKSNILNKSKDLFLSFLGRPARKIDGKSVETKVLGEVLNTFFLQYLES